MEKIKRTQNVNTSLLNSLLVTVSLFTSIQAQAEQTNLVGPYLGQKEPTETPEVFAPNAVSNEYFAYGGTIQSRHD